jgi:hypothetical protein
MNGKIFLRDSLIVMSAVVVGGGIMYGIMVYQQQHVQQQTVLSTQTQVDNALVQIGKLIELPKEIPTIATVSDVTKLQDQQFFSQAKNGDKVLIFAQAKEAILYRPSENKLIHVAPLNIPSPALDQKVPEKISVSPVQTITPTSMKQTVLLTPAITSEK